MIRTLSSQRKYCGLLKKAGIVVIVIVLTLLTQVGGLIYLLNRAAYKPIEKWINNVWLCSLIKTIIFVFTYCAISFFVVPILAKPFGRVALSFTTVCPTSHVLWQLVVNQCCNVGALALSCAE